MIINLTQGFKPFGDSNVYFEDFTFPSGIEQHIKFEQILSKGGSFPKTQVSNCLVDIVFTLRINSMQDLMKLFLATDALRRIDPTVTFGVFFPYLPYARQDRVMVKGEPLSIKVFADLINSQNYNWVGFYDVHSEVSVALINNSYNYSNVKLVQSVLSAKIAREGQYYICSPDAGALKKIYKVAESVLPKPKDIVICNKLRDVSTGKITHFSISHRDLCGKDVYIVDDICSRGGTFMKIAEALKERKAGKIYLIVSHWEDTADRARLSESGIDTVYTTNSLSDISFEKINGEVNIYPFKFNRATGLVQLGGD